MCIIWSSNKIGHDHDSLRLYKNLCNLENVSKTIGENKVFEGHISWKSEIGEIRLKYVSFLNAPNRHVRQTIEIMQRAQRYKIEEIGLK